MGRVLKGGNVLAGALAVECYYAFGRPEADTLNLLEDLFSCGLLEYGKDAT